MKRLFRMVRDLGITATLLRGRRRAGAQWERLRGLVRARRAKRLVSRLPKRPRPIAAKSTKEALVSVAVLGGKDWRCINRCLSSLQELRLNRDSAIRVYFDPEIENEMALHAGVQLSPVRGKLPLARVLSDALPNVYLYVIDPGAVPDTDALGELLGTLDAVPNVAIAGSKVCSPADTIIEAGRSIESDGSMQACGAGFAARDSRYDFLRDVDAVSPDSFAVRPSALSGLSLSPLTFESRSYELADLCLEVRNRGWRCVCQPRSVVLRADADYERNPADAEALRQKWRMTASATQTSRAILFVDEHVPFDDRDAGSRRAAALLRWARAAGWSVLFGSRDARSYGTYGDRVKEAGIELLLGFDARSLRALAERGTDVQRVWLTRPSIAAAYLQEVRRTYPLARIIYDTVDLHFVRLSRQAEVEGRPPVHESVERQELEVAGASDCTVVTTAEEAAALRARGIGNVEIVGLSEAPPAIVPGYQARSGILFVGNYAHAPNVDAACWLAGEIMPRIWQRKPEIGLTLAGADPVRRVRRLSSRRVRVPGFIDDLSPLFASHRVFAASLRFGAGLKGKIVQSLAAGLPVVTTSVGAEGIATAGDEMLIAGDAQAFADSVLRLYDDPLEWRRYSESGRAAAARRFSPAVVANEFYSVLDAP